MSNRYLIGIPGWSLGDNSFGAGKAYMQYLSNFGDVLILPMTPTIFKEIDLLVLPGGKDVLSDNYGEAPGYFNTDPDLAKEYFLRNNLQQYLDLEIPTMGICLGFQQLQVALGGSLIQNAWHDYSEKSRSERVHEVKFTPDFKPLQGELKIKDMKVNSLHHQGIDVDGLAEGLQAVVTHDGLVEAFVHESRNIAGVQWHPEELWGDAISNHLIFSLLKNGRAVKTPAGGNTAKADK